MPSYFFFKKSDFYVEKGFAKKIIHSSLNFLQGSTNWYLNYQLVLGTFACCGMGHGWLTTTLMEVLLTRVIQRWGYLQSLWSPLFTMILLSVHQSLGNDDFCCVVVTCILARWMLAKASNISTNWPWQPPSSYSCHSPLLLVLPDLTINQHIKW